jgi:hypothetical protein
MHNTLLAVLVALMVVVAVDSVLFFERHLPSTTRSVPQTTMDSGPSSANTTYNGDPSFSFSSSESNGTFECKLDSGSWISCTSPKSYSGLADGEHAFSVRAIDQAGNADPSPETRQWRVWECSGKQIVPGDDLDARVNADSSTVATTFCIHAGTYAIDHTINVRTGDRLLGEVGATTTRGPATYPTNPPVKITNATNLTRLIQLEGENVTLQWLDLSGARSLHNADGSPKTGTGMAIAGGEADGTTTMQYLRVHDNDANGIGSPRGKVLNSEFFRNTLDPVFLGHAGAAVKGIYEYEAAYNYVHEEQGNGFWCDRGCEGQGTQPNGFWVHHNLLVNNERYGVRYEHSAAFLEPGVHATQPSALIENNEIHANGYGGTSMHDAQNGVFRYNDFGLAIIDWVFYPHNGAGAKAMQFSEGDKTTSLYNAKAYGNTLGGEYIQGCSMPENVVYCANNRY